MQESYHLNLHRYLAIKWCPPQDRLQDLVLVKFMYLVKAGNDLSQRTIVIFMMIRVHPKD
jgi:hypothetical protein